MLSYKLFITDSECVRESIKKLNVKCVKSNVCKSLTAQVVLQALIFFFQVEDSVSVKDILISADKLDHKKANGIIYSLVKEEILQSVSPVRIRTSNSLLK